MKVGFSENIIIIGKNGKFNTLAKFDTGSSGNSIDTKIAAKIGLGPIIKSVKILSSSNGYYVRRPVVKIKIKIKNKTFLTTANIEDREKFSEKILIGRNMIKKYFTIDLNKK